MKVGSGNDLADLGLKDSDELFACAIWFLCLQDYQGKEAQTAEISTLLGIALPFRFVSTPRVA
jgi:hypothetical protein